MSNDTPTDAAINTLFNNETQVAIKEEPKVVEPKVDDIDKKKHRCVICGHKIRNKKTEVSEVNPNAVGAYSNGKIYFHPWCKKYIDEFVPMPNYG